MYHELRHRINDQLEGVLDDLRSMLRGNGEESLAEYGLSFDYVPAHTFNDQREGYFRYQLSWGGPSDEFRFFTGPELSCHRIEYWFLGWFDGASRTLDGNAQQLLIEVLDWFHEMGCVESALAQANVA